MSCFVRLCVVGLVIMPTLSQRVLAYATAFVIFGAQRKELPPHLVVISYQTCIIPSAAKL